MEAKLERWAGQSGPSDHAVLCSLLDIAAEWPDDDANRIHLADFRAGRRLAHERLPGGSIA
jgi:hypothetical protein